MKLRNLKNSIISIIFISLTLFGCVTTTSIFSDKGYVKLIEHRNLHFIRITLNGIDGNLLVDTGATKSVLDISKSEEYGFKYILLAEDRYIGLGGIQDIYAIYNYEVDQLFIPFMGTDLSGVQEHLNYDDIKIVGIIGADFLEKYNCKIDLKNNLLYYNVKENIKNN